MPARRPGPRAPLTLRAEGERVIVRAVRAGDARRLIAVRKASEAFLAPWSPLPLEGDDVPVIVRRRLLAARAAWREDRAYRFHVLDRATGGEVIGGVALNDVTRGVFQNAHLGYWIGEPWARSGRATEAVRLVLALAFGPLGLHRVQAAIIPRNAPSLALAARVGLRPEGTAQRYLQIAGRWEDHAILALTSEEWSAAPERG